MSEVAAPPVIRRPVVWIADDSPTEREILERSMGVGYAFRQFSDGSEVLEQLVTSPTLPDVLLLDWLMPGMSGDEVCRFLRSQDRTRQLPIILVTASRLEMNDVVKGLSVGANDYVARPFEPAELHARVDAVLRTKQLQDIAAGERTRLKAINQLGRALFEAGNNVQQIIEELTITLTSTLCDGCSVLLLPGEVVPATVNRHLSDPTGAELAAISTVADPMIHAFESSAHASRVLPPAYQSYIAKYGLRALGILPFPTLSSVQGIVTVTRDGASSPLEPEDVATIETCIEYASLAVQNAMLFAAERTLQTRLKAIVEHAPTGIVVTDGQGAMVSTNPVASRLVPGIDQARDLSEVYALARWTTDAGVPIARSTWMASYIHQASQPLRTEVVMHPLDGGPARTLSVATVSLFDDATGVGGVTTIEDVTAEREIKAERERIAGYQEQMLGIVGHDLRNPLGAILAGSEAVEHHGQEIPAIPPLIKRVRSSVHRMSKIIDQLADVTRARLGGGIPVDVREVQLTPMIRGVLDELALAYPAATFELRAPDSVVGLWDADRLSQVISNLASNAAQYGLPRAPIVVDVSCTPTSATITVTNQLRDKPIGTDRLKSLFEPYKRGSEGQHHASGLGLGLYIVHEIVRAHGGTISADSTTAGTVFRVELPVDPRGA